MSVSSRASAVKVWHRNDLRIVIMTTILFHTAMYAFYWDFREGFYNEGSNVKPIHLNKHKLLLHCIKKYGPVPILMDA